VYALVTYALLAHLLIGLLRPQEPDGSDVRPGQQDLVAPMAGAMLWSVLRVRCGAARFASRRRLFGA
jgi:hypothetical protein